VFRLDEKTAFITGASSGIGQATAIMFAQAGARVVTGWHPKDPHDINPVLDAIEKLGGEARPVEVDVTDPESVEAALGFVAQSYGGVDIVVANAGIARRIAFEEMVERDWQDVINVDLGGVFRCFRSALPLMPDGGRLLATSSISGAVTAWSEHAHYTAAKAGVIGLVRTVAIDVAHRGITVNAVAPGVIVTPQSLDEINSLGAGGLKQAESQIPLRRNGRPEDVAATFVFLASDEASYITGQTIVVDGGVTVAAY